MFSTDQETVTSARLKDLPGARQPGSDGERDDLLHPGLEAPLELGRLARHRHKGPRRLLAGEDRGGPTDLHRRLDKVARDDPPR